MQIISVLSTLIMAAVAAMNYDKNIDLSIVNNMLSNLAGIPLVSKSINLALFAVIMFILGEIAAITFFGPLYQSLKTKYNAYKRELEKGSISNTSSESKIKVLENKITVLEKALEDALKNK